MTQATLTSEAVHAALARAHWQGFRDGYLYALADAEEALDEALVMACSAPDQAQRIEALRHTRALLRGLRARAGR